MPSLTFPQYLRKYFPEDIPYTITRKPRDNFDTIAGVSGFPAWAIGFSGNSKQRRQQRRKFLRDVNVSPLLF